MQTIDYLIDYLLKENKQYQLKEKPFNYAQKFNLYRSLCNLRKPREVNQEYMAKENKLLQSLLENKEITNADDIRTLNEIYSNNNYEYDDVICLWQGDITALSIDTIVNAANSQGLGCFIPLHSCIDNQIHTYAGIRLRNECDRIMKTMNYNLPTSDAFITKAYNLPSKHVIHTVGPIITDKVTDMKKQKLGECYFNCLNLANKYNIESLAFPCISTGVFRFPKDMASSIALKTVDNYLNDYDNSFKKIVFNVYSKEDLEIYERTITKNQTSEREDK